MSKDAVTALTGKERQGLFDRRAERKRVERELEQLTQRETDLVAAAAELNTTGFCACGCGKPSVTRDWYGNPIVNLSAAPPPELPSRLRAARSRLTARLRQLDQEDREAVRWGVEMRRRWRTMRPGLIASGKPAKRREAKAAALVLVGEAAEIAAETAARSKRKPGALYLEPGAVGLGEPSPMLNAHTGRTPPERRTHGR